MCGEKASRVDAVCLGSGSPPRVRGKVYLFSQTFDVDRITPACAGKRGGKRNEYLRTEDHPRVCGEKAADLV